MFGIRIHSLDRKDILVFVIGLFSLIKVRVMGTFGVSEILCFCLYFTTSNPFLWTKHKETTRVFMAFSLWMVGVFISDRYNDTGLTDSLKGFFNVFFVLGLIPFVYWALYDNPRRMLLYWIGCSISSLLAFYVTKSVDLDEVGFDVWRVYAWHYPFLVLAGVLYYKGKITLACAVAEGFAIWSLFHLSRNIFITVSFAVCVILFIKSIGRQSLSEQVTVFRRKFVSLFLLLGVTAACVNFSYEYLASNKILGERAYAKYYMQKHSEMGLASGRGDFFQSMMLVSKNPVWGYGSYAKNKSGQLTEDDGMFHVLKPKDKEKMLPGHSYIMGAWGYAGILGLTCWICLFVFILKFLGGAFLYDEKLIGINVFLTTSTLWNVMFSPFADRLNFLFYIITISVLLANYKKSNYGLTCKNIDSNPVL